MITEITAQDLDAERFIDDKVSQIRGEVGAGTAINALSGGVDSSTVTMLGHRALGPRLKTVFIENGLMREGEPEQVASFFRKLGVEVEVVDARAEFFASLEGITDPEEKREAITRTFYRDVFVRGCAGGHGPWPQGEVQWDSCTSSSSVQSPGGWQAS